MKYERRDGQYFDFCEMILDEKVGVWRVGGLVVLNARECFLIQAKDIWNCRWSCRLSWRWIWTTIRCLWSFIECICVLKVVVHPEIWSWYNKLFAYQWTEKITMQISLRTLAHILKSGVKRKKREWEWGRWRFGQENVVWFPNLLSGTKILDI